MKKRIIKIWVLLISVGFGLTLTGQTFTNTTSSAGIMVQPAMGDMVIWVDHNNDGWLDFFGGTESETFFYENNGDGTFVDISLISGLSTLFPRAAAVGDCDNDGYDDLLITSFHTSVPTKVYRNMSGQGFVEVFTATGSSHRAIWLDYNADGLLDFISASSAGNTVLYLNQGNCSFEPASDLITFHSATGSIPAAGDYNNDGLQDIFFASTNTSKTNRLYMNVAGTAIQDETFSAGVSDFRNSVSAAWGDMDNNGFLDLYYGNIGSNRNVFLYNKGDGTFEDRTIAAGIQDAGDARTCTWQDINNDGWLDLFTTNHINPNRLYINNTDGTFTNIAAAAGIAGPQDGFGISWGDFDRDGDLDVLIAGHSYGVRLLRNDLNNNTSFLNLKLLGVFDNRSAIGARVTIYSQGSMQMREVNGGRGATGQDALNLHFGLGNKSIVDSILISWPSGASQKLFNIPSRQFLTIEQEGNIPPTRFKLYYPYPDSIYQTSTVEFSWQLSHNPDDSNPTYYFLHINSPEKDTVIGPVYDTVVNVPMQSWMSNNACFWYIVATDGEDNTSSWEQFQLHYDFETSIFQNYSLAKKGFTVLNHSIDNSESRIQLQLESDLELTLACSLFDLKGRLLNKQDIEVPHGLSTHKLKFTGINSIIILSLRSGTQQVYLKIPLK
ncbi:MAG: CRTAC1 family protein [Bacteroidales bacterium]|nr:CRTAC1 family protein [Bacteroidales bacterium]